MWCSLINFLFSVVNLL